MLQSARRGTPCLEQAACYGKAIAVKAVLPSAAASAAAAFAALAVTAFTARNDPAVVDKCMTGFANLWKPGTQFVLRDVG